MHAFGFTSFFPKMKKRTAAVLAATSNVDGHVDVIDDAGFLHGWACSLETPHIPVYVKCVMGDKTIGPIIATGDRPDVLQARGTTATCGFAVDIDPLVKSASDNSALIEVYAGYQNFTKIGQMSLAWTNHFGVRMLGGFDAAKVKQLASICAQIMMRVQSENRLREKELPLLGELAEASAPSELGASIRKIVAPTSFPQTLRAAQGKKLILSNYIDQQRFRLNYDRKFRVELSEDEQDSFLKWYLEKYAPARAWRRAPLSRAEIDYLNEPGRYALTTRAMAYFFPAHMKSGTIDTLDTPDFRRQVAYWWAVGLAPALFVEDCLVPDWCVDSLRSCRREFAEGPFPVSRFMEQFFFENKHLHFLDLHKVGDRILFWFYLLFFATDRPDILRFLPHNWLLDALANHESRTSAELFERIDEVLGLSRMHSCSAAPKLIKERFFDLATLKFNTVSRCGARLLGAALGQPKEGKKVDVQIIGPFEKASGLGQAARLSARMIAKTGLKTSTFNFGMDNPAPEGFSSHVRQPDRLASSRVNIIHLNGESVPLVFAYTPDVFTNSYNIGYFYWELDSPAACHHLSLELLDEIWVSSEYCRETYAKATSKPVINVGMCAENVGEFSKQEAREFVFSKIDTSEKDFVFLAAFDSFSFVQRKNPIGVIRAFKMAFPDDERMRLVLKTHNRNQVHDPQQHRIWDTVEEEIAKDSRITLLDETLSYKDLRKLKKGADCYVSLHRSEGWGFGMIEAMASGVPVVATGYSGNMEFCNPETCWLVDYEMVHLYPDDYIFVVPGQQWAEPRLASAAEQMRSVAYDRETRERRVARAAEFVRTHFSDEAISKRYGARLCEISAQIS